MSVLDTFAVIRRRNDMADLPMILTALGESDPAVQRAAVEYVLTTRSVELMTELFRNYHKLEPTLQDRIADDKWSVFFHLKELAAIPESRIRINVLDLIQRVKDIQTSNIVLERIRDKDPLVKARAVEVMVEFGKKMIGLLGQRHSMRDADDYRRRGDLVEVMIPVVRSLLRDYEMHREPFFIELAIVLGGRLSSELHGYLAGSADRRRRDIVQVMETTGEMQLIEFLFKGVRDRRSNVRDEVKRVFGERKDSVFAHAVGRHYSIMARDELERAAMKAREIIWWPSVSEHVGDLDVGSLVAIVRYVDRSGIRDDQKVDTFTKILRKIPDTLRSRVVSELREGGSTPGLAAVVQLDPESQPASVQSAILEVALEHEIPDRQMILKRLAQSAREESIRRRAIGALADGSFEQYLRVFDHLDEGTRQLAGRAIAKVDRSVIDKLSDEISSLDPDRRLRALKIVETVGKERDMERVLLDLIADPDRRVRATAVKIAGLIRSADALMVLTRAMNDEDRRIRANAIEAIEELGSPRLVNFMLPYLSDPDNRVRANAAKAIWSLGRLEGGFKLAEMLRDENRLMRLSAAWALGEIDEPEALAMLKGALPDEQDEQVLARIEEAIRDHEGDEDAS